MNPDWSDDLDRSDMEGLVAGRERALDDLMDRHAEKLFHYLFRSLSSEEDAADLAQETFVRVYQNRARFDMRRRFSTWLYAIASNLIKGSYRYRSRHPQVSLEAEKEGCVGTFRESVVEGGPTPSESMQNAERAESVRIAVGRLPDELRTTLILFEYQELSYAEIAAILACTPKAVEMRIYRARERLREDLGWLLRDTT